jgi:hypothetical protein
MKQAILFMLLTLLVAGCKKGTDNPGLECGVNSHFENGACICNDGWFGWNCDRNVLTDCGPHGTGYENWCICDTGWIGNNCHVPIGSLAGTYHVVGEWSFSLMTSPPTFNSGYIDTILQVTQKKDTLFFRGRAHLFGVGYADTSIYYPFGWSYGGDNYSYLSFHKTADDSLFYSGRSGGMAGGTTTNLVGIKLQ